jgi:L-seryl-tRNA(Ser) seleniumtransferase
MPGDVDPRRRLPSIDQVLQDPEVRRLEGRFGRDRVVEEARRLIEEARGLASEGRIKDVEDALARMPVRLGAALEAVLAPSLVSVINATGVIVHTNLGRAPLPEAAARRVAEMAAGYSNLEYDLVRGDRGQREVHAETRLRALVGAEAAVVVNNNAAAVLLAVNTFAEGREVLVSRGELVEIGGSFRIPDVLRKGGGRLVEVGTTNRTRLADFRDALTPETGLILKVHPSNFKIVGFTEGPSREELVALSREAGVPLVEDLGSGLLTSVRELPEPTVAESLAAGVEVVTFSGDKLLGGPQAGMVVGRAARLDAMRRNALYRALRVDKMTLAALDAVLAEHQSGRARDSVPVLWMLAAPASEVRRRAHALMEALASACPVLRMEIVDGASAVGGGAAPAEEIPTALLRIVHPERGPDALAAALRAGRPAVVARVADGALVLDLRTVRLDEEPGLHAAIHKVCLL